MTRTPHTRLAVAAVSALVALGGAVAGFALTSDGGAGPSPLRLASADAPATTVTSPAPGEQATLSAGEAGTVSIERTPDGLRVVSADAAPGWASSIPKPEGREVEVRFTSAGRVVELEAELDDGRIKVKVRERLVASTTTAAPTTSTPAAPTTTAPTTTSPTTAPATTTTAAPDVRVVSAGEAGSITVAIVGRSLELRSVDPAPGWDARVDEADDHEVEVRFTRDARRVDLKVELEDGDLRVRLEARAEDDHDDDHHDNSGPGSTSSGHDDGGDRHGGDGHDDD